MYDVVLTAGQRAVPITVFLVVISMVAELSDRAGVFTQVAHWVALAGRGRLWALWLLFTVAAALCTILLAAAPPPHLGTALAILVGTNAGPLVTPWASIATILWLQRCRAAGVRWSWRRLGALGALCATASVTAGALALAAAG